MVLNIIEIRFAAVCSVFIETSERSVTFGKERINTNLILTVEESP